MTVDWHWSAADIAFLAANGPTMTAKQLGVALDCPAHVARRRASRDGVVLMREKMLPGIRPYSWTDERKAEAARRWHDGWSASRIANHLGGVTRNAVIGAIHRMGLSNRPEPSRPVACPRPTTAYGRKSVVTRPRTGPPRLVLVVDKTRPERVPTIPLADVSTVSLMDLNSRTQCCWNMPDDLWCAEPKTPGGRFCATHRPIGINPATSVVKPYRDGIPARRVQGIGHSALSSWGDE